MSDHEIILEQIQCHFCVSGRHFNSVLHQTGKYYCSALSQQTVNIRHTVRTLTLNAAHVLISANLDLIWIEGVTVFHTFSAYALLINRIFSNKSEILNIDVM